MKHTRLRSGIAAEALDWFVRNRGESLGEEDRAAFSEWLRSSPQHIDAYLRTAVASESLRMAAHAFGDDAEVDELIRQARTAKAPEVLLSWPPENQPLHRAAPPRRSAWLRVACACVLLLAALCCTLWLERDGQRFGLPKEFITGHGEQRSWLLPDGSGLDLHSDSAVIVRFSHRERVVDVQRGQALFQVAHERARRFRVVAGRTTVIAVGTEFDVNREAASTLVTVLQGRVAVLVDEPPPPSLAAVLPAPSAHLLSLVGGQQARVDNQRSGATPALVSSVNVERTVAWVKHQIAFDREPLAQVANEFNHYSNVPIEIQSERLRDVPVSGVLNQFDTDSFLAFISRLDDVRIVRLPDRILVTDASGSAAPRSP